MRDVFKQRKCEQFQTSDLKTGKQKDCIRQKGGGCSNCKGKVMQNNESGNKLLPAHTDIQLTVCAVPLPNAACCGGHNLEGWFLRWSSLSNLFSLYVLVWVSGRWDGDPRGVMHCESASAVRLRLQQVPAEPYWAASLLAALNPDSGFPGFNRPLQMKVPWDAWWADIAQLCSCLLFQ